MASRKITVTIPQDQLRAIRELVAAGQASSVSGFVQHAIGTALDDVAGWRAMLAEALAESGGPPTEEERAWAEKVLSS
ncbi:MAG: ribbon-helix-helix domain-containing protein [Egibacteraceae bacterium]